MGPTCGRNKLLPANALNIATTATISSWRQKKKRPNKLQAIIITAIYCDNWKGKLLLDFQTIHHDRCKESSAGCRGTSSVLTCWNKFNYLDSVAKTHLAPEGPHFQPNIGIIFCPSGQQKPSSWSWGIIIMWGKDHLPYFQMKLM